MKVPETPDPQQSSPLDDGEVGKVKKRKIEGPKICIHTQVFSAER
jgi:hypothetical protein